MFFLITKDKNSASFSSGGLLTNIISFLALCWFFFQMYTAFFGNLTPIWQRSLHMAFASLLMYLILANKTTSKFKKCIYIIIGASTSLPALYIVINFYNWIYRFGKITTFESLLSMFLIIFTLDMARRKIGLFLPILTILFLSYAFFGPFLPGILYHRGYDLARILNQIYLTTEGVYGIALSASNNYIFLFVVMGALLLEVGAGDYLFDISKILVGRTRGGPAKIAVISSAFFGSISGSAQANVATTGSLTIPLMKKMGFKSEFAGAVEAVASTGGQLMPPVMGAAGFLMAEILGVPYLTIMKSALVPACIYFLVVFLMVHFQSLKRNISVLNKKDMPGKDYLLKNSYFLFPLFFLLFVMIIARWYPLMAVSWTIVLIFVIALLKNGISRGLIIIKEGIIKGVSTMVTVVAAVACAAMIMAIVNLTGLGLRFSSIAINLSGGNIYLLLLLIFIASIILGLGLPTTVVYLILAGIAAPALVKSGIPAISAHLFVLYGGMLSMITLPVAMAVYVASSIAESNIVLTGIQSMRLGIAAYFLPFYFALNPSLLLEGSILNIVISITALSIVSVLISACLSQWFLTKMSIFEIILSSISVFLLLLSEVISKLNMLFFIILVFLIVITLQYIKVKKAVQISP